MKILMVSMPSIHFFRWVNQLKDTKHEVYWFDISGSGTRAQSINWVTQITNWKLRQDFPGRTFIKKIFPFVYKLISKVNERDTLKSFQKTLKEVNPDLVHSFALYVSCKPILEAMNKHKKLKWIYSSWGSDLFYFQNIDAFLRDIKAVLPRVNYMFSDCHRDFKLAEKYGFNGEFLGVFPGGGGYAVAVMNEMSLPTNNRKTLLVKGYQGRSGRALTILKAIDKIKDKLKEFEVVVFGTTSKVFDFVNEHTSLNQMTNFKCYKEIPHNSVLELMGKSLIYIGNSNSDGTPNTLLEAIIMGAFPIQSNPGGATAEVIDNGKNGLLINDPEDVEEIVNLILKVIDNKEMLEKALKLNKELSQKFEFEYIQKQVLNAYQKIEESI